ncbi:MAG: transcription antitermination factor NusB [Caldithrix sp.]|nr:transcription antitermination factor NusB [Caldithrix sp.]
MKRRREREFALRVLFAHEFNPVPIYQQIENLNAEFRKFDTQFARSIIDIYTDNKEHLDRRIETHLINWDFGRLAIMDRVLLRMALVEFLYMEDIPPEVTINEIIEISKMYSTDKSSRFVNGMLDAILKKLIENKEIVKSGRGLISNIE